MAYKFPSGGAKEYRRVWKKDTTDTYTDMTCKVDGSAHTAYAAVSDCKEINFNLKVGTVGVNEDVEKI